MIILIPESTHYQIKALLARYGRLPEVVALRGVPETPKAIPNGASVLQWPVEPNGNILLLLKVPHTLITGHREFK